MKFADYLEENRQVVHLLTYLIILGPCQIIEVEDCLMRGAECGGEPLIIISEDGAASAADDTWSRMKLQLDIVPPILYHH